MRSQVPKPSRIMRDRRLRRTREEARRLTDEGLEDRMDTAEDESLRNKGVRGRPRKCKHIPGLHPFKPRVFKVAGKSYVYDECLLCKKHQKERAKWKKHFIAEGWTRE